MLDANKRAAVLSDFTCSSVVFRGAVSCLARRIPEHFQQQHAPLAKISVRRQVLDRTSLPAEELAAEASIGGKRQGTARAKQYPSGYCELSIWIVGQDGAGRFRRSCDARHIRAKS